MAAAVCKYLPSSLSATDKGHMKRQQQGIWSKKVQVSKELDRIEYDRCMNPPKECKDFNQLFCCLVLLDPKACTVYTDFAGKFPLRSIYGNTILVILSDWTTNTIPETPVIHTKESTIIDTLKNNVEYLTTRGFKTSFNIMANVANNTVETCLTKDKVKLQLVEPHYHQVKAAEHAIQTFKNHLIECLSTVDDNDMCPTTTWDQFIPQAQDSLNMLWTS
jgi:hypothetical protein